MKSVAALLLAATACLAATQAHAQTQWGSWPWKEVVGRLPGDIRVTHATPDGSGFGVWTPKYPTQTVPFGTVLQPWTQATSALYGAHWMHADKMPGNEFFSSDQYGVECDNTLVQVPAHRTWQAGNGLVDVPATYACKISKAPVVDMDWVRANLDAGGYTYVISYPKTNHGHSRAEIVWIKACMLQDIPYVWNDGSGGFTRTLPAYCYRGMARLEGAPEGWTNQFAPATAWNRTADGWHSTEYPLGSSVAAALANWPEPWQGTGVVLMTWYTGIVGPTPASQMSPRTPTLVAFSDAWLGGAPTPPTPTAQLPPIPPYVPAGDPSAINVGGVSAGAGAGSALNGTSNGRNAIEFDYAAFCLSPGRDGQPRSPSWVANCMAGR